MPDSYRFGSLFISDSLYVRTTPYQSNTFRIVFLESNHSALKVKRLGSLFISVKAGLFTRFSSVFIQFCLNMTSVMECVHTATTRNDPLSRFQIKTVWRWSVPFCFLHRFAFQLVRTHENTVEWLQNQVLNFWVIVKQVYTVYKQ